MSAKRRAGRRPPDRDDDLVRGVEAAVRSLGWTAPQCDEDVLAAERRLAAEPVALPAELQEPAAVWNRPDSRRQSEPVFLPFPASPDIDATLARAAREAGRLSPEIEERMRRDREAAEGEFDDEAADQ